MGDYQQFQPLTKEDRITTLLYRTGIFLSSVLIAIAAFIAVSPGMHDWPLIYTGLGADIIIVSLYFSVGLSVFFIHLYIGKFHRILKKIYYLSLFCLALMFLLGKGSPASMLSSLNPAGALLLIPLSLCLGFITAKEAFCFKLLEGYLLGLVMPAYLFFYGLGLLDQKAAIYGLALIAAMLVFFMFRKVFMPLHCDIGDKSAYQP